MKKVMLINVLQPEECRIAILENGILEELYVERNTHESYVGNIYKGKIVNIEPSIQAAFVDFGIGRNGFYMFPMLSQPITSILMDTKTKMKRTNAKIAGQGVIEARMTEARMTEGQMIEIQIVVHEAGPSKMVIFRM